MPPGPAAVRRMELRVPPDRLVSPERALRSLIIQMECDGERTVWCPTSDFFGSGVGLNRVENWYRTVDPDGTMVCRWVMPYPKNASVTLLNLAGSPIHVGLTAIVGPWMWDEQSMHFHAVWHHEAGLMTSRCSIRWRRGMARGTKRYGWMARRFRRMSAREPRITMDIHTRRWGSTTRPSVANRGSIRE